VLTNYTYNDENRLTQISQGSTVIAYTYDPFGRRISKNVNGTITNYVYDNDHIIAEYNSAGTLQTKYTHGPGIDEPLARTQNTTTYFYHADALGSIMALTNTSGKQAQVYTYNAFGKITHIVGPSVFSTIVQPYAYTGREYDPESGLYFYRARYYDPKVGRFITRDPAKFKGGINLYAYVKNNPVNKKDPKGLYGDDLDWCDYMPCYVEGMTRVEAEWMAMIDQTKCMAKCALDTLVDEAAVHAAVEGAAQLVASQVAKGLIKKASLVTIAYGGYEGIKCIFTCGCPNN
jgi:RHS repeat-associated protein